MIRGLFLNGWFWSYRITSRIRGLIQRVIQHGKRNYDYLHTIIKVLILGGPWIVISAQGSPLL